MTAKQLSQVAENPDLAPGEEDINLGATARLAPNTKLAGPFLPMAATQARAVARRAFAS